METVRITLGYHHGWSVGQIIRCGRKPYRIVSVGLEAFNCVPLTRWQSFLYRLSQLLRG